jgi:hypothetical protein
MSRVEINESGHMNKACKGILACGVLRNSVEKDLGISDIYMALQVLMFIEVKCGTFSLDEVIWWIGWIGMWFFG